MSKHALKIQQVDERHEMLQRERINAATWPGKDLREIAVLQVTINNLEQSHAELVSAVREMLSSYDEWRKPEQGCVSTCDFWERLDKLEEMVK